MELRELIDALVASPDDDALRRVYADALLEAGEPQGELIHLQCDLAAGGFSRTEAVARRRRERELFRTHGARWIAGLRGLATNPVFRRGCIDEVTVETERFPEVGEQLFAAAPMLRGVVLDGPTGRDEQEKEAEASTRILASWQRAITSPAFRRIRGLALREVGFEYPVFGEVTPGWTSLGDPALAAVMAGDTSHLEALDVLGAAYGQALFEGDLLKRLTRLAIRPSNISVSQALFAAMVGSRLRSLDLVGEYFDRARGSEVLAQLTELRIDSMDLELPFPTDKLERFTYANHTIRDEHVDALVASIRHVRELSLEGDHVPGYRRLAKADLLHLRALRVHGRDIGFAKAEEILRMPCAAQLEVLELQRIDDEGRATLEEQFGVVVDVRDLGRPSIYWR